MRNGFPGADADGKTAQGVDHLEPVLVGKIISDEDRSPTAIGRLLKKFFDHLPFSGGRGKNFCHGFAELDPVVAPERLQRGMDRRVHEIPFDGSEAPMYGDRAALVLDQDTGLRLKNSLQTVDHLAQPRMIVGIAQEKLARDTMLEPMKACNIESMRAKALVEEVDGPAADERERTGEAAFEVCQNLWDRWIDDDGVGALDNVDEGSIEVEKQGPVLLSLGVSRLSQKSLTHGQTNASCLPWAGIH